MSVSPQISTQVTPVTSLHWGSVKVGVRQPPWVQGTRSLCLPISQAQETGADGLPTTNTHSAHALHLFFLSNTLQFPVLPSLTHLALTEALLQSSGC